MNQTFLEKFLHWAPRITSIVFILFISLFALDVFSVYSGWGVILPLFMHLLPSLLLLIVTITAWRYDLVGASIFMGFAIFYVWDVGFTRPVSWYLTIALPSSVVGILYLLSWMNKRSRSTFEMQSNADFLVK